jgi:hypothetical protein
MNEPDDYEEKRRVKQGKIDHKREEALDGAEENLLWHRADFDGRK